MSIQSEMDRIIENIASAYLAVNAKGGTLPAEQNSDHLPDAIDSIPGGYSVAAADASGDDSERSITFTGLYGRPIAFAVSAAPSARERISANGVLAVMAIENSINGLRESETLKIPYITWDGGYSWSYSEGALTVTANDAYFSVGDYRLIYIYEEE